MVKTHQRGFTLIELVVVIVILGILAAFAVPRFMGLENEARAATIKSMGGTLRSAASMAHGMCIAQNCGAAGAVTIDGVQIRMVNGYPNRASIQNTLQTTDGFTGSNPAAGQRRFAKTGARTANCWIQYNEATAATAPTVQFQPGIIGAPAAVTEAIVDTYLRANC